MTKHLSTSAPPSVPPWDFPIAPLVKDTELMELASDGKLKEIGEFCGWWGREVSPRELLGRKPVTDQLQGIDVAEWKMRVSRWGNRLKDYERYKADIILAAMRKAGVEAMDKVSLSKPRHIQPSHLREINLSEANDRLADLVRH